MKSNLQQLTYPLARIPKMASREWTLHLEEFRVLGAGALLLLLALLVDPLGILRPLRLLLGAVYVLFVPGYCLSTALFPKHGDLERVERVGLGLGLSIAAVPLLALLLDRLPWGVRMWPVVYGEMSIIALGTVVTMVRRALLARRGEHTAHAYTLAVVTDALGRWRLLLLGRRLYSALVGLLLLLALSVTLFAVDPLVNHGVSEFYILGEEGLAEQYPQSVAVDDPLTLTLGIANRERGPHTYSVEIWVQNPWSGDQEDLVARAGPFELDAGDEVQQAVTWTMPWAGTDQQVEFLLFTSEQASPEPYRQLRLWTNVVE